MYILQVLLVTAAVVVSLVIALMLVNYLIRVIKALQSITAKLDAARTILLRVADQTEPAPQLIPAIGNNVATLHKSVMGVAKSLGLI